MRGSISKNAVFLRRVHLDTHPSFQLVIWAYDSPRVVQDSEIAYFPLTRLRFSNKILTYFPSAPPPQVMSRIPRAVITIALIRIMNPISAASNARSNSCCSASVPTLNFLRPYSDSSVLNGSRRLTALFRIDNPARRSFHRARAYLSETIPPQIIWGNRIPLILLLLVGAINQRTPCSAGIKPITLTAQRSSLLSNQAGEFPSLQNRNQRPNFVGTTFAYQRPVRPSGSLFYGGIWRNSSLHRTSPE